MNYSVHIRLPKHESHTGALTRALTRSARRKVVSRMRLTQLLLVCFLLAASSISRGGDEPRSVDVVATDSLHRKVMTGYQGWFRCPGDAAKQGWRHWSRNGQRIAPETVTFEMWPDLSEFGADEKYPATGFTHQDGSAASLFSSTHPTTVDRHFEWMQQYGIDGAFLQRFVVELGSPSLDQVLDNVRASAKKTGRAYALCYDMSGAPKDRLFEQITSDWKRLVDEKRVTEDDRYLRHNGKPVLIVWGFFSDRFSPELAHQLIDFFKSDSRYGVTLVGGCQWYWRNEKDAEWSRAFRRFDVISPWNVGNYGIVNGQRHAATDYWKEDLDEAQKCGMEYLPVLYPGFAWTNLQGPQAAKNTLPRLGGEFFWRQFTAAADIKIQMAYVAMFDEVDEGTAIFKVTNSPPKPGHFETYEGLPSDWYLRLTGEGSKLIRGDIPNQGTLPIKP